MAGFRRLCGRFRCVAGPIAQNGAEGAKFKRLRRLWGIVPVGRLGGRERNAARPCTGMIRGACGVFNGVYRPIKWRWRRAAPEG